MKKLFTLILALVLLLSAAAIPALAEEEKAESKAWPVIELQSIPAQLISDGFGDSFRYQSFSGPGKGYSLAGAYLPRKVTVSALGCDGDYALIDVEYNGGRRCVYLEKKYVTGAEISAISMTPVSATTKTTICPMYYGPGNQYDEVKQRSRSKYADMSMDELMKIFDRDVGRIRKAVKDVFERVTLVGGSRVNVLFEVNGWVCIESDCTVLGKARTWIPADQVDAE